MAMSPPLQNVVPAQLGFLTIYNPSLGATDATVDDQIVYYASVNMQAGGGRWRRKSRTRPMDDATQEERNKRLRQIGLAQGMVEFGRSFSGDHSVDSVETEKTRVVLHELEPGWWILASVDLTRLPAAALSKGKGSGSDAPGAAGDKAVDYSSREVKPAALLLQDLLRAHSVFLLHHDSSLSSLFRRTKRTKFVSLLTRYWDMFLSTWNVMLHGNPIVNVFGGIKIAASGELGVGVGEEDRGSGEREVLEGLVGRIEGLVDLVVSKFGSYDSDSDAASREPAEASAPERWLGTGSEPAAEDGAVFLGTGAISRRSLRNITYWMEDMFSWGANAYGVRESPTSTRRARASKPPESAVHPTESVLLPPTPVTELARRLKHPPPPTSAPRQATGQAKLHSPLSQSAPHSADQDSEGTGMNHLVDYLKLGYGKYWSIGGTSTGSSEDRDSTHVSRQGKLVSRRPSLTGATETSGRYLIGMIGDVEEPAAASDESTTESDASAVPDPNSRTMLRTVTVEVESRYRSRRGSLQHPTGANDHEDEVATADGRRASYDIQDRFKGKKLRVVVYVNRPFIFTFLFRLRTDSLAWDGLYKSLHHQLAPLRRPLANSTTYRPGKPDMGPVAGAAAAAADVYDLVWDPRALTIHSTIPSIPDAATTPPTSGDSAAAAKPPWTRVEALNTHTQMLNMYLATRADASELERTCKTSRGWWVVWNRITDRELSAAVSSFASPSSDDGFGGNFDDEDFDGSDYARSESTTRPPPPRPPTTVSKEIFLVRKASDHGGGGIGGAALRSVSASYAGIGAGGGAAGGITGGGGGWADGASRLAQGIGVDTRRYIEGLLSLNR